MQKIVTYHDVADAARVIEGVAHRTPVLTSRTIDARSGATVFFKAENLQRTGAFKFRGAYNALSRLDAEQRARGVVTFSSGNHAQAVALAGRLLGIQTWVVMPSDVPRVKIDATRGYGAEVILFDRTKTTREAVAAEYLEKKKATLIPPFDHEHVIAGQGTAAKELLEETGPLDYLLTPVGGGGLISGCAIAFHALSPGGKVIGVEPDGADDANRSFRTGTIQKVENPETIADGVRTTQLGNITFPLILQHVQDMMTVSDAELIEAMFCLWERMKIIVEPTAALPLAALFARAPEFEGKRVGIILSGGNVEFKSVSEWIGK